MQKTHHCNGPGLPDYPKDTQVKDVNVWLHDSGMIASHDYSCSICRKNHAILDLNSGIMQVCNECHDKGYSVIKVKSGWRWLIDLLSEKVKFTGINIFRVHPK